MLFNSGIFLFAFLPVTWIVFFLLTRVGFNLAIGWVCFASLVFYAYSSVQFLAILLCSVVANYSLLTALARTRPEARRRALLVAGIAGNLCLLGYFKYANFLADSLRLLLGAKHHSWHILLPLGISFYTFQKIALLVDVYRGKAKQPDLFSYAFFISFFPQLIAGPIVHYDEIAPQLVPKRRDRIDDLVTGLSMFIIGLFKKVVIADTIAQSSTLVFTAALDGATPAFADAWLASLCYALQIYFDFSAYSDMAIGLGRMFGIDLPINFASPYKARSIIEFWRRWHITLSRLLRDYIYIPFGGSRRGTLRTGVNVLLTMLIGGLWHGAAWAYVVWGGLHGLFLLANHGWRALAVATALERSVIWRCATHALTLVCIVIAWVPFRTADTAVALRVWEAMFAFGTGGAPPAANLLDVATGVCAFGILAGALLLPNSAEIMSRARLGLPTRGYPATDIAWTPRWGWAPDLLWAALCGLALGVVLVKLNDASEFIYFQF